jgi:hypothetical protein
VPDHSTVSKNRHGRFRDSDLLRRLFEATVRRCMAEGIVGGEGFVVDASTIRADASRQKGAASAADLNPDGASRAVEEYLTVLDDAAFGAATEVPPRFVSPTDLAARWTAAAGGLAYYAYCDNYLIDVEHAVIVDVEASTAVRQAEVGDICPGGKKLLHYRRQFARPRLGVDAEGVMRYRATQHDCGACALKSRCSPRHPARKVLRSIHEGACDMARDIAKTETYAVSRRQRKKVEMLFAHLKRILRLDRLRLRGPNGARDEFHLAAAAQNLRTLAKLIPVPAPAPTG